MAEKKKANDVVEPMPAAELIMEEAVAVAETVRDLPKPIGRFLRILGPGIVTGAADDDPSGIATYSQAGTQFGFGILWTMLWAFPLMTAVQEHCAMIGAATGKGLAAVVKEHYSRKILFFAVLLMIMANVINIGADIGAMASTTNLIVPISPYILAPLYSLIIVVLVIALSYRTYVRILKWLALTLLAYLVTALIVHVDWGTAVMATIKPHWELNKDFIFMVTAILGTTISPYLFFWQTSEVVEEEIAQHRVAQKGGNPRLSRRFIRNLRFDNAFGMFASDVTAWFIILVCAVVLHSAGVTTIRSAADAAKALQPLVKGFPNAGLVAEIIFTVGVVGLGLLAIPTLAGSASYGLSESFGWKEGLYRKYGQAKNFYRVIVASTLVGLLIVYSHVDPIQALIWTAVFNAIAAVPLLFLIGHIGRREDIMGENKRGWFSNGLVWLTFVLMGVAAIATLYGLFVQ